MPFLQRLARDASGLLPGNFKKAPTIISEGIKNVLVQVEDRPSAVIKRSPSATSSSSSRSCGPNDKSPGCEKPQSSSDLTLPIVLATVIPVTIALVIFFFLHRRHLKRLRAEDENDKHKSLDFGMGDVPPKTKKGKAAKGKVAKAPEMSLHDAHMEIRRGGGQSMDLSTGSPYLLPPGLQASRESIHSLTRSLHGADDRYRPATTFHPNDRAKSPSLLNPDDSSSFTASTRRHYHMNESSQNLLRTGPRVETSFPLTQRNSTESAPNSPLARLDSPLPSPPVPHKIVPQDQSLAASSNSGQDAGPERSHSTPIQFPFQDELTPVAQPAPVQRRSPTSASPPMVARSSPSPPFPFVHPMAADPSVPVSGMAYPTAASPSPRAQEPENAEWSPREFVGLPNNPHPVHDDSARPPQATFPVESLFHSEEDRLFDQEPQLPNLPPEDDTHDFDAHFHVQQPSPENDTMQYEWDVVNDPEAQQLEQDFGYDVRRLTMGIRPLPPDDPSENPEQRANRIRSFYKEYFDESTPAPRFQQSDYFDDYTVDFTGYDAPIYDPNEGQFIMGNPPYAEPITRRAMTPPPRGPKFRGGIPSSTSDFLPRSSRAYSSASARYGPHRSQPRKHIPPPKPLSVLPTPHMLKDDTILPIDFAPPQRLSERMQGTRPDSPKGGFKPFAPQNRPHKALVSSFDDLAVIPSPHALRKSGTFTSLDFALPPRFKNAENASDAGSIRSNRSGMSTRNLQAIRAGAFRLSRVPKDQVGTTSDFAQALKPSWDMR